MKKQTWKRNYEQNQNAKKFNQAGSNQRHQIMRRDHTSHQPGKQTAVWLLSSHSRPRIAFHPTSEGMYVPVLLYLLYIVSCLEAMPDRLCHVGNEPVETAAVYHDSADTRCSRGGDCLNSVACRSGSLRLHARQRLSAHIRNLIILDYINPFRTGFKILYWN